MNTVQVNVCPHHEGGYVAVVKKSTSMWAKGAAIDEAIEKFKKDYNGLLAMQFIDGPVEFDFHVKLKENNA